MVKTIKYTENAFRQFRENLQFRKEQGVNIQFEIRIDGEQVVGRTDDLSRLESLSAAAIMGAAEIAVIVYKGQSNHYDKYVFEMMQTQRPQYVEPDPRGDYDQKLASELHKFQQQQRITELERQLKKNKRRVRKLKNRNGELEEETKSQSMTGNTLGIVKGIVDAVRGGGVPGLSGLSSSEPQLIDGASDAEIIGMLKEYKKSMSEETFQAFLGIILGLAKNQQLIPQVSQAIERQLKNK